MGWFNFRTNITIDISTGSACSIVSRSLTATWYPLELYIHWLHERFKCFVFTVQTWISGQLYIRKKQNYLCLEAGRLSCAPTIRRNLQVNRGKNKYPQKLHLQLKKKHSCLILLRDIWKDKPVITAFKVLLQEIVPKFLGSSENWRHLCVKKIPL